MRFLLKYRNVGDETIHSEEYDKDVKDPREWGKHVIEEVWNGNLRPHEIAREFVDVEILDSSQSGSAAYQHDWEKTNLVSLQDAQGVYDNFKCRKCGAEGYRYGISDQPPMLYEKFRKKNFDRLNCKVPT